MNHRSWRGLLVAGVLGLSACHHHVDETAGADQTGQDGTQTFGVNSEGGYDESGMHHNSTNAPEDQVYYFNYDADGVSTDDRAAIDAQGNYLSSHPDAKVRLEGNTDERGSREYNIGLGWRRAQAVQRILEQDGASSKQIAVVSYGKEKPADAGHTEAAWKLNRRVNLVYEAK
ncbi:MAG TPA: peptidoglycan-associated lipoprotein Pal [Coxiellaceae bacterium]|nr:peptidoglycan-associated lipoprotein Pal [Coxiellaceae bacterium]